MGRPRKPIQKRSNGVYCVQLHLGGKRVTRSLGTRDIEVAHRRAAQAMAELEAAHKAKQEGETRWRDAKEFSRLLELSEALDPETTAQQYTGKRAQDDVSGAFLDENTEALAQALFKREVPATWNDLIREVERIRTRKNLSPFSASWHRNVGIAIKQCPFELAEATPQAIREWIDQMQDSGLSGLTINSKCSLLSGLVAKCMKSGLLRGMAVNPFDAADYSAGEASHIYTAIERDYRDLSLLLPKLLDRQLIPVLIQVYCGTRISEVRNRRREDFDLERGTMQVAVGTAKNKASVRTIPLPPKVLELLKQFPFEKGWGTASQINIRLKSINPELTTHSFRHGITDLGRSNQVDPAHIEALLGHRLSISQMSNVYGQGYDPEVLRKALSSVWKKIDSWLLI
jgi:integrase